jgi:hypothetical protein
MSLSEVGTPGQKIDVLHGGDVDPSGRLLSVAEIQQAFRELLARPPATATNNGNSHRVAPAPSAPPMTSAPPTAEQRPEPATVASERSAATEPAYAPASAAPPPRSASTSPRPDRLQPEWIAVVAAHAGAGASTVALAIADVLAASARPVRLIETAHPARSGLVAAASAEMGLDPAGEWRRGSRELATIYRRTGDASPAGWPHLEPHGVDTVIDLGLPAPASLSRLVEDKPHLVVVCRPCIPGVRITEHLLAAVGEQPVVLAAVGPKRWPGEVTHSLGPRLRLLRERGLVIAVDDDRALQVTGPTHAPLPKAVLAAAGELLRLICIAPDGASNTLAHSAPRSRNKKGTTR